MDVIEIKLPELSLDDMVSHECYACDGVMTPLYVSGAYKYKGRDYRVSSMRVWKCYKCHEAVCTGAEADRIVHAIYEKAEELDGQ